MFASSSILEHRDSELFNKLWSVVCNPAADEQQQLANFKKIFTGYLGVYEVFTTGYHDRTRGGMTSEYERLLDLIYERADTKNIGIACELYSSYNRKPLLEAEKRLLQARENRSKEEATMKDNKASKRRYDECFYESMTATTYIATLVSRPCYEEAYIMEKSRRNADFTQKIFEAFTRISLQPIVDQAYKVMFGRLIVEINKQIDRLNVNAKSFFAIKMGYKASLIITALDAVKKYCKDRLMEVAQQEFKKGRLRDRDYQDNHIFTTPEKSDILIRVIKAKLEENPNASLSLNAVLDYKAEGQEFSLREALNFQRLFSFGNKAKSMEEIEKLEKQMNSPTV